MASAAKLFGATLAMQSRRELKAAHSQGCDKRLWRL